MSSAPSTSGLPPLVVAHLVAGLAWLCLGVGIGMFMAFGHDFTLRPVHAHVNLLGWVTNALFGMVHWFSGRQGRVEWAGFAIFNAGCALMCTGLTGVLLDIAALKPAIGIGAPMVIAGILVVFGSLLVAAARSRARARSRSRDERAGRVALA